MKKIEISLDAMGGDNAPEIVIKGASEAKTRYPDISYTFFGDKEQLMPLIESYKNLNNYNLIHTKSYVKPDDKPSNIIRKGLKTSMAMSINAVKLKKADAIVSAGNTGALMGFSKLFLRTMPGINRPAIATCLPTIKGELCMLDLGANLDCDKNNLVQFAIMGQAFAKIIMGLNDPRVSLLNIGEEETKGLENIQEASKILIKLKKILNYYGFVEGDQITNGLVDVIVTDGFTGNIALKTAEGTANFITNSLKQSFNRTFFSKIGYLLAKKSLESFKTHMDPRKYNGAVLLGLNGITVKSHGGTDSYGFSNAIGVAYDMVKYEFLKELKSKIYYSTKYLESKF